MIGGLIGTGSFGFGSGIVNWFQLISFEYNRLGKVVLQVIHGSLRASSVQFLISSCIIPITSNP
jgi:hypothetical protein